MGLLADKDASYKRKRWHSFLPASQAVAYIATGTVEEVTHLARRLSFVYLATHPVCLRDMEEGKKKIDLGGEGWGFK